MSVITSVLNELSDAKAQEYLSNLNITLLGLGVAVATITHGVLTALSSQSLSGAVSLAARDRAQRLLKLIIISTWIEAGAVLCFIGKWLSYSAFIDLVCIAISTIMTIVGLLLLITAIGMVFAQIDS